MEDQRRQAAEKEAAAPRATHPTVPSRKMGIKAKPLAA
jgi:hypothetical protein